MRIISFETKGLFGIFNHFVPLNQKDRLTLIHGPNGFGKTTVLRMLRDFFSGKFSEFGAVPFKVFSINLENGQHIQITPLLEESGELPIQRCLVSLHTPDADLLQHIVSTQDQESRITKELARRAPYMQHVGNALWEDTRDGELLDIDDVVRRYSLEQKPEAQSYPDWLNNLIASVQVRLIETQRLVQQRRHPSRLHARSSSRSSFAVVDYARQLAEKVQLQSNEYTRLSQQLDRTFVLRLLKRDFEVHGDAFPENSVAAKVENLNEKRRRLREAGLLSKDDEPLPSPEAPNSVIDEILNAYLQDVEHKLAVFDDLLVRIELLRSIVDAHLDYKTMVLSQRFGFQFRATYDLSKKISPVSLSSGEQHILILFYELLFNDASESLILIDEPEISLHLDWQLTFLLDLRRIVSLVPHDIVLATHSPQIINNDWNLTVALGRPERVREDAENL